MRLSKFRIHHWNCSKFANWIRGEKKPHALELHKWSEWHKNQKENNGVRYWLSETFLQKLQDVVYFPVDLYRAIKIYITNRYIDKIHYLKTGLVPGEYYDFDYRVINALFNELVDFVELELSASMKWDSGKKYKFVKGRCQEAQDDYFKWANHLKHQGQLTEQAKASRKIQKLYEWWKNFRPQRKNPYDNDSLGDVEDILDNTKFKTKQKLYQKVYDLEKEYEDEDTKMLIELIKIRNHLWT